MENFIMNIKTHIHNEIKKKENLECFKLYLVEPALCHIMDKIYPYMILVALMIILLFILVVLIFISMLSLQRKI